MLYKVTCVRALLMLCLFEIGFGYRYHQTQQFFFEDFANCEDVRGFRQALFRLPATAAIQVITLPLQCNDCPVQLQNTRMKLITLVRNRIINVSSLLMFTGNVRSLSRYDILITTLMAIDEYAWIDNSLKQEIRDVLLYLLRRRYLKSNNFVSLRQKYCGSSYPNMYTASSVPRYGYGQPVYSQMRQIPLPSTNYQFNPYQTTYNERFPNGGYGCQNIILELVNRLFSFVNRRETPPPREPVTINTNPPCTPGTMPCSPVTTTTRAACSPLTTTKALCYQTSTTAGPTPKPMLPAVKFKMFPILFNRTRTTPSYPTFPPTYETGSDVLPGAITTRKPFPTTGQPFVTTIKPFMPSRQPFVPTSPPNFVPTNSPSSMPTSTLFWSTYPPFVSTGRPSISISTPSVGTITTPQFIPETTLSTKRPFESVQNLIRVIPNPKPEFPKEKQMYNKFKVLLTSPAVQEVVNGLDLTKYPTDTEKMDVIITKVLKTVKTEEVQQVFRYYVRYKEAEKADFNYGILLEAIPRPKSVKEENYFKTIQQLLSSEYIYGQKVGTTFSTAPNLSEKLIILLKQLESNQTVSTEISEAVHYYISLVTAKSQNIDLGNLITLIPEPTTETETQNYNLLKQVLEDNEIYVLMQNVALVSLTTNQRLTLVLRELIKSKSYQYVASAAIYYRNLLAEQTHQFNYYDLLKLITATNNNSAYLDTMLDYFYTPEFDGILSQLKVAGMSNIDKLLLILQVVSASATDVKVIEAAKYLLPDVELQVFHQTMDRIILLIPLPKNPNEELKYNTVKSFLTSEEAIKILGSLDFTVFPDTKHLSEFIFKTIVDDTDVSSTIKDAFEYYIDLAERLQAIEFITKKEIKKNFKLTEIFTNTLNMKALTLPEKDAFKKFFKYISEIKPDALSTFDSWDQAKTRGQFMKLLFKFLLDQPGTLPEIKESIKILNSLVKMDGKGALPP